MLSLGVLASATSAGTYTTFTKYANVSTARYRKIVWNGGTAVFATSTVGVTESGYSTTPTTSITAGGSLLDFASQLAAGNNVVIATEGTTGNRRIQRTTDNGATWSTVMNTAAASVRMAGLAYNGSRWVSAAFGDNDVYTSDDNGATWTLQSGVLVSNKSWVNVSWNGTNFIAIKSDGETTGNYYYSPDGVTWTAVATSNLVSNISQPSNFNEKNPIAGGTTFMAHQSSRVRTSSDGITWTTAVNLATSLNNAKLAYGNGTWVAVGFESSVLKAYKSTNNGVSWTALTLTGYTGSTFTAPDITFYNNKFWIVDTNSSADTDVWVME